MMKFLLMQFTLIFFLSIINLLINMIPSFNKMIHPMIMNLLLLMLALINSMNMSMFMNNHWMSFIMFLIIISGLMILFMYFNSFNNNLNMSIKWMYLKTMPLKFMIMLMFIYNMIYLMKNNFLWYNNFNEINKLFYIFNHDFMNNKIEYSYMYMLNKNLFTLISMIYMFITLTFIVKICLKKKMSIRKINY